MITRKTKEDIRILAKAGAINSFALKQVAKSIKSGVSTYELEGIAQRTIKARGGEPSFLGYRGYKYALCVSINDEVVHGMPSANRIIKAGDIIGLDLGVKYKNRYTDAAITVVVGKRSSDTKRLLRGVSESLKAAIKTVRPGVKVGDIEFETGRTLNKYKLSPILALSGHGVGFSVHEEPSIKSDGIKGRGETLKAGMVLAIEPMAALGAADVEVSKDGWTVATKDGSFSAHFEHTIVVTDNGSRILTEGF